MNEGEARRFGAAGHDAEIGSFVRRAVEGRVNDSTKTRLGKVLEKMERESEQTRMDRSAIVSGSDRREAVSWLVGELGGDVTGGESVTEPEALVRRLMSEASKDEGQDRSAVWAKGKNEGYVRAALYEALRALAEGMSGGEATGAEEGSLEEAA